jgi:hypothetical protein
MTGPSLIPVPIKMVPSGKSTTRHELRGKMDLAKSLVCEEPVTFFDTVEVLLRRSVEDRAAAEIGKHCRSLHYDTSKACGSGYPYRLSLQQPQPEALKLIGYNLDHIVSRFDVAIDLPTETHPDADLLTSMIKHLQVQPWHGKRRSRSFKETAYVSQRSTARNLVIYGDNESKVTKGPCCHIEFRYHGARACKARGVRTCHDLLMYDHGLWIDRDVKLALIDWPSACSILCQLGDQERRRYRRDPSRRPKALLPLVKRTFERLQTPDHTPSFDEPSVVATQRQLEVMPKWSTALVSASLTEFLRAYA